VAFAELGLAGAARVRDRWKKADVGTRSGGYTAATVPSHGAAFLKITGQ
jgi:hypothetical protein